MSAAAIGGAVGQIAGSMVDSWIVSSLAPAQRIEGQRLQNLTVTTSTEGAIIPRTYGRMRLGGNIIWATDFTETINTTSQGGKGGGPKVTTTTYLYTASFAVALAEGPISGIGRVWADGKPLDLTNVTWRIYKGDETQTPDPFIEAKMGTGNAPAYRGTAYVMFEALDLTAFGNRIPQLSFEVLRPIDAPDTAEGLIKAVTMIPATGEFQYGTTPVSRGTGGNSASENVHSLGGVPDIIVSLDQLQAAAPHIESVSLVVAWFGLDLRAGNCAIQPGVENATKVTTPVSWAVSGVTRAAAHQITTDMNGKLAYGGTPSDATIVEAIKEIKARGLRVTFYPFLLMDIPAGNALANPYSDNAATIGQDKYPWRGRITCSPAAGFVGTVDKTTAAATQVAAFFGTAGAADFSINGEVVRWIGGNDWGYRRFILHYAHLCAVAGGVDAFLLGSELVGLTTVRDGATTYPAVAALKTLASDVANLVTVSTGTANLPVDFSSLHLVAYPGDDLSGVLNAPALQWEGWQSLLPTVTTGTIDTGPVSGRTIYHAINVLSAGMTTTEIDAGNVTLNISADQSWQWGGARLRIRAFGLPDLNGAPDTSAPHPFAPLILDVQSDTSAAVPSNTTNGSGILPAGARWIQFQIIITDGILASNFSFRLTTSNAMVTSGRVSYAADWSEYFGHHPQDGSGDVLFHLDPLWASPDVHFIGIDNYLPLSDWRDGSDHLDAQAGWPGIHDLGYLQAGIEGGEQFDWFYASNADRTAQARTPIVDSGGGSLLPATIARSFGETTGATITNTAFGGTGTRNNPAAFSAVVPLPAVPSDGVLFERGGSSYGMLLCVRAGGTVFRYRAGMGSVTAANGDAAFLDIPVASLPFDGQMHELIWDVTLNPSLIRLWVDGVLVGSASTTDGTMSAWAYSGSGCYGASGAGITNIAGEPTSGWPIACPNPLNMYDQAIVAQSGPGKDWVFRPKDIRSWWSNAHYDRPGGVESMSPTAWTPQSKPIRFTELGCPAVDRGPNQPNVFYDPKSAESAVPYFSRGWQDEAIQRQYLRAMLGYWGDVAKNPSSTGYSGTMIDMGNAAVWTWDARPYPDFPARADVWADAPNWRLGHWLNGRLGTVGLATLVRELCMRAGLDPALIDTSDLFDIVAGYAITALESPRASISTLARHFGFDAVESGGVIRFVTRGQVAVATITPDGMIAKGSGDVMELTRGQETELPQALKWQVIRSDAEYDPATVEARRVTVAAARVASESFPLAVPMEEADRRCRRALMEAWVGRETLSAHLPPSMLSLDPGDVVGLANDGRLIDYRITKINDALARSVEAIRTDATLYDLPPGQYRKATLPSATVYGPPNVALMDLPQISDAVSAHQPYAAVYANPWYGTGAIWRSVTTSGFTLLDTIPQAAHMGALAADFPAGPTSRFDLGNELLIDMSSGTLTSVTDLELFAGANTLAVESAPGVWEIVQFGNATLVATGRYSLTRLLRGQRGTEDAIGAPASAGSKVVLLDTALQPLSMSLGDIGIAWNMRTGPASAAPSDAIIQARSFTPNGRGLMPFAPAQARMRRLANGDLALRWLRRDRALAADSWVLTDVPMSETSEAYDLEIMSGATINRSLSVAAPAVTYTAAMQTTDFGGPVTSLSVRLYQIGALGRGIPLTETLTSKESL